MHPRDARAQLAAEAGRLMADQAIDDPFEARRRAAERLGVTHNRDLPTGEEIIAALRDHLALFMPEAQRNRLSRLRGEARAVMRRLEPLAEVRLTGPVLEGTASAATPITLHLLGITGEEVAIHLLEQAVPFRERTRQVSYGPRDQRSVAAFQLRHGELDVELLVFTPDDPRQAPLDPVTGRAQRRATLGALEKMLEE